MFFKPTLQDLQDGATPAARPDDVGVPVPAEQ